MPSCAARTPTSTIPAVSLSEYVLGGAAERGDKPALIDGADGAVTTYAEFADQVARAAAGLAAEGIGPGDAVGLLGPELAPTGRSPSTRSSRSARSSRRSTRCSRRPRSAKQLASADAVAVIVAEPLRGVARRGRDRPRVHAGGAARRRAGGGGAAPSTRSATSRCCRSRAARPALSKGVMLTHRNLVANMEQIRSVHRIGADDVLIGAAAVLPHLRPDRRGQPRALAGRDDRHHAALRHGRVPRPARAPPRHARARRAAGRARAGQGAGRRRAATSRCASSSPARRRWTPTPPNRASERLGAPVRQGYGMTEASPVTHFADDDQLDDAGPGRDRPADRQHRGPARRPGDGRGRRDRRGLDPRAAGHARLPRRRRGHRGDADRGRLAARRATSRGSRTARCSGSSTASRS